MFRHHVFQHDDWPAFQSSVIAACGESGSNDPQALELQRSVPAIVDAIAASSQQIMANLENRLRPLECGMKGLQASMDDWIREGFDIQVTSRGRGQDSGPRHPTIPTMPPLPQPPMPPPLQQPMPFHSAPPRRPTSEISLVGTHADPGPRGTRQGDVNPSQAQGTVEGIPSAEHVQPPKFVMDHTIDTVDALYREFHIGILGKPSVLSIEQQWGTAWRKPAAIKQFFMRRKKIIDEIKRLGEKLNGGVEEAVQRLDEFRRASRNRSLSALADAIVKGQTRAL